MCRVHWRLATRSLLIQSHSLHNLSVRLCLFYGLHTANIVYNLAQVKFIHFYFRKITGRKQITLTILCKASEAQRLLTAVSSEARSDWLVVNLNSKRTNHAAVSVKADYISCSVIGSLIPSSKFLCTLVLYSI